MLFSSIIFHHIFVENQSLLNKSVNYTCNSFFMNGSSKINSYLMPAKCTVSYHTALHSAWLGHKNENSWLVFLWHFCNVFDLNMTWGECGLHIVIENLWKLMFHWPMFPGFSTKSLQFCLFASMRVAFLQPNWAPSLGTQ